MLVAYSGRCRWPARSQRFAVVVLFACLGFGALAADGFSAWTKTQMWSRDCQIRGLEWVADHGWFAVGSGAFDDSESPPVHGLVVQSTTGASGWSDNLFLVPDPWDPGADPGLGAPMAGVASHDNTLLVMGPDAVYTRDFTSGTWSQARGWIEWDGDQDLETYFCWGGGAVWGNGRFVLTNSMSLDWPDTVAWTSTTGVEWTASDFSPPTLPADGTWEWDHPPGFPICYSGSRYVAVSSFGWIITSTDGNNWQTARQGRGNRRTLRSVAEKDGVFVAVGDASTVLRSTNGTTWTRCTIPATVNLHSIAAGERWFMAVGDYEVVLVSADGETWQSLTVPAGAPHPVNYTAVGFGNDRFIIASHDGKSLLSGLEPWPVGISVSPPGGGTASVTDRGVLALNPGAELDVTAIPTPGYRFVGWSGDLVQSAARLTTPVNGPLSVVANFVPVTPLRVAFREGPKLSEPRMGHRTVTLADGSPVPLGGHTTGFTRSDTMDTGTPEITSFSSAQMPATADGAAVAKLADGQFLIAGGASDSLGKAPGVDTAMLLSTTTRGTTITALPVQMVHPRMNCAAGRLAGGPVLVVGGWYDMESATYGELFTPGTTRGDASFVATGALNSPRSHPLVIPTADGGAVVAGGLGPNGRDVTRLEAYDPTTNTFSILAETPLNDGEPWILNTRLPGDVRRQQRSDGTYVFWAWHARTEEGAIFLFDPITRSFTRVPVFPSLGATAKQAFMPVIDATETRALVLVGAYDEALVESQFLVHVIDLITGKGRSMTSPVTVAGYFPAGATLTGFVQDGTTRLLLAGGCSELGLKQNFHPVARTFVFDPMLVERLGVGEAACISTDFQGIREDASNVRMTREPGGALYVTYTRAARSLGGAGWFTFVRRRDASGSWRREVRTERFPDSSTANSILVDGAGRVHQGLTFNVGAFHTYTTFSSRATRPDSIVLPETVETWDSKPASEVWRSPTPIWDGGWRDFDYDTKLAMQGDRLFSVSIRAFGWADYPMNLMLREWRADTGWGTTSMLTALPNEAAAGYGVQGHRFQVRPDGFGVVLYGDRPQTDPQQVKLLEVGLPFNTNVTVPVSAVGRWGRTGDVAVDSDGVSHLVWMEADAVGGVYELWYATHHTITGLSSPVRISEVGERSIRSATIGTYGGGRVLVAYGVAGSGTTYGGVFLRKITSDVSDAVQVGGSDNAHGPGLRSTWNMPDPNAIDLTWVEVYSWGSQLLHQEFDWDELGGGETAAGTIHSNELTASFTLDGPLAGDFTLVNGEWTGPALPAGLYTITWQAVAGMGTPPPQVFEVTGDGAVVISASYIDENLHRVITLTSPVGAGAITMSPVGTVLLGGDTAHGEGTVAFTARPVEGQGFVRWRVDNGLGISHYTVNPLLLTIDRDTEVTAEFGLAGPFHVDSTLYGAGTITPGTVLPSGSRFVCTITPAAGTALQEVLLDGVSQGLVTEVVIESVSGPHSIQAFTDTGTNRITATWLPEDGGQVVQSPTTYNLGDTVTVTAEPAAGYRFVEWRGDASGTDPSIGVLVDRAKAVRALFAPNGVILGDLNDDGAVSIEDAVIARQMYAGTIPVDLIHGDMDQNGWFDTADIAAILRAEARGDRPCLGGQQVAPDFGKRLVSFTNGIGLTLPGGWPDSSRRASVALGLAGELPPLPPSLEGVTPIYDIRLAGTASFGRDVGFQIPVPATARRSGDTLRMLFLDPESNDWVTLPTRIDTSRAGTTAYGRGRGSGKYTVANVSWIMDDVQGTHCVVYYDRTVSHELGTPVSAQPFAQVVADSFDAAYKGYQLAGYDVPPYTTTSVDLFLTSMNLDRRADIYITDRDNTYKEPFYSWKTKNYYLPAKFDDADDVLFNMTHEMFHAIQNRKFSGPSMAANRWLFEMIAEYASRKAPHTRPLSTEYGLYLATPLGTINEIHEYSCAHLMDYLLKQAGGTFKSLWSTKLATSYTPYQALNSYAKSAAGMSLGRAHAHYLTAMMFDSDYADLVAPDTTAQVLGVPWASNVIDTTFTIPKKNSAGWMKSKFPPFACPANVLVEILDDIPGHVNVRVFNAPVRDPKIAGGRTPLGSFFSGESLPFVSTRLATDQDSAYVTGYNYFGWTAETVHVRVRPLVVNVTQTPDPLVSGAECTFVGTVAPVPDCAQKLKVYWKLSDGTPWQIETVAKNTAQFEFKHTFAAEKDATFQVTFEVYCLDAGGRRRPLVKHTQDVAVSATPSILLFPNVIQAETEQNVALSAQVRNAPDTPGYQWTFGDVSSPVSTSGPAASHTYATAGSYAVTVALVDTAEPTVVLAQTSGRVVVLAPVQVVDDPPTGNDPDAPTLDYSKLKRVDETRFWDGVREVYFVDGAGRKHGLYQSSLESGMTSRPLDAGMYIHGRQEGQWRIHWQDGSDAIDSRHYHGGLWVGTNATARETRMMVSGRIDGAVTDIYLDGPGMEAQDWPAYVAGRSCVLHYGDGTYETVAFDASGRRHGLCTLQHDVNVRDRGLEVRTISSGQFNAGVKTGFWKYLEWSGNTATGVTYNHSQDPPNQ